jgi:hypothetical protein
MMSIRNDGCITGCRIQPQTYPPTEVIVVDATYPENDACLELGGGSFFLSYIED